MEKSNKLFNRNEVKMAPNKVLITEDEAIIAMDLAGCLTGYGFNVVGTAVTGEESIAMAQKLRPHIILMDIRLKGDMSGICAAKEIVEKLQIPIIFLTSYSNLEIIKRATKVLPYGYLIKPFRREELLACVEVALVKYEATRKIEESKQWFSKTLCCISDAVVATDPRGNVRFLNPTATMMLQKDPKRNYLDQHISKIYKVYDDSADKVLTNPIIRSLDEQSVVGIEHVNLSIGRKKCDSLPIEQTVSPIINDDGETMGAVLVFRDISKRKKIEFSLRDSEKRFHNAFNFASIGMALVSIKGEIFQVNEALCSILGYQKSEILACNFYKLCQRKYREEIKTGLFDLDSKATSSFVQEIPFIKKTGQILWNLFNASVVTDETGKQLYYVMQFQDVNAKKHAEEKVNYLVQYDSLTGLLNRAQLDESFSHALMKAERESSKLGVMFIDLDRFKLVNDSYGHHIGDELLKVTSARIRNTVRQSDIVARVGGDEFVLVLTMIDDLSVLDKIASKLIDVVSKPVNIEGKYLDITVSIGISKFPKDGYYAEELLVYADNAMYQAKESGKNRYHFFSTELSRARNNKLQIEQELKLAMTHDELELYYQPIYEADCIIGVESLIRWNHPIRGFVAPGEFIPIAEESNLIVDLGYWVLEEVCRQIYAWQQIDLPDFHVAVNLSAKQFHDTNLIEKIHNVLLKSGLNSSSLVIEITETSIMNDIKNASLVLSELQNMGVKISVDDFGTGYSSLSYLKRLPLNYLKIDRSFIIDVPYIHQDSVIVEAIIALAHSLNLTVIAEGVETKEQANFLKNRNIDYMQGFLFNKPIPSSMMTSILKTKKLSG